MMKIMNVKENVRDWYVSGGNEKIQKYVIDENTIYTSRKGAKAGVYQASVIVPGLAKEIIMYIGEVGKDGRGFRDRLTEHLRHWIENPEHFTGLTKKELKSGYRYSIKILAYETDDEKRYALEQKYIEERKPYLQWSLYSKYSSEYEGFDLCIFPTHRRRAFLIERDGTYKNETEELFVNNIFEVEKIVSLSEYKKVTPKEAVVTLVEKEMPKGSDICTTIKKIVDRNLGISTNRGCNYRYLVRIVAAALESRYCENYIM